MQSRPPLSPEAALAAGEARCDALLSLSLDGVCILDRDGRVQRANDVLCRLLDRQAAEVVGQPIYEFLADDVAETLRRRIAASRPDGRAAPLAESRLARRDGSVVEIEASGAAVASGDGFSVIIVVRPIAQRKQMESALGTTRERLRSVFDALGEGVVVQDAQGRIVDSNPAAKRILGLDAEQLAGRSSVDPRWRAVHDDGSPFPGETHPAMVTLRTAQPSRGIVMGVHKPGGSLSWISINAEPLFGSGHAVAGVVTSFSDITASKAHDRELDAERQLNRRIIETAPFGICIYDENGDCLAANPAMARDIGATLPQVLAQNYHRIDAWKRSGLYGLALKALEGDAPLTMAGPVVTSFGRQGWLELTCRGLDLGGRRGLMLVTHDLTDAKRAEHALEQSEIKFRSLVQQAADGIFIAAPDGRYTEVNDAGCRMLGYARDEILARRMQDLVAPAELQTQSLQLERLRSGVPLLLERRMLRKDGSIMHAEISARALPDGSFLGLVRDIGARKAAEEALRAREVAERSNRAKSEFVSRMSHELRTPLNAILGFAELLAIDARHALDASQKGHLEHIRSAGRHLLALIDDLLDLSSIEAGTMKLQLEDLDLRAVLAEALHDLAAGAAHAGVRLSREVPADVVPRVRGDRRRLRQVVANLVSNAIKYNRPGGAVVVRLARAGERVRLAVIDDGLGMTPQQLARLFEPFNRLGREASAVEGTGIGLVITRSLVELMGGDVSVRSEPDRGSEFVVALPAAGPSAAPSAAAPGAEAEAAARGDVGGRVLYIEDDEVNRVLMQAFLEMRPNVRLVLAVDGRSGVRSALADPPDVVLIDMSLPDIGGLDVLQALRAQPALRGVPCVAVSANAMPDDVAAARAAGIDDYLTKPLSAAQLLATLDALLGRRRPAAPTQAGRPPASESLSPR